MSLTVKNRQTGNVTILDLNGRITLGDGAVVLRDAVKSAVGSGAHNVLLNLGGVTYIDSAGLGELVGSRASAGNAGGNLKLLNLQKRVRDLLLITKLHTVFEVFEDEAAAVASFGGAKGADTGS
jgi:anti-sigma B factor antagonist